MELCKDCAYYREVGMCYHPSNVEPVNGKPDKSAWWMRRIHTGCGPDGMWFAPQSDAYAVAEATRVREAYLGPIAAECLNNGKGG